MAELRTRPRRSLGQSGEGQAISTIMAREPSVRRSGSAAKIMRSGPSVRYDGAPARLRPRRAPCRRRGQPVDSASICTERPSGDRAGSALFLHYPSSKAIMRRRSGATSLPCRERLALDRGTIKAHGDDRRPSGAFERDEILHALKEISCGLNCGRWDYISRPFKRTRPPPTG